KADRQHEIDFPFNQRWLLNFWQDLFFTERTEEGDATIRLGAGEFVPDANRSADWNRGAYLVEALAHCTECHTPRNDLGGLQLSLWMAGSSASIPGKVVPNITPDLETGLGAWSVADWQRFLKSGVKPDFHSVGAEMAEVVRNTSALMERDRVDMILYLR